jgi:vacuolar-type H+-ATPase subunit I/STV1
LFAVMFGDLGHGFIIFCAALYMIWVEKRWAKADLWEVGCVFFVNAVSWLTTACRSSLICSSAFPRP